MREEQPGDEHVPPTTVVVRYAGPLLAGFTVVDFLWTYAMRDHVGSSDHRAFLIRLGGFVLVLGATFGLGLATEPQTRRVRVVAGTYAAMLAMVCSAGAAYAALSWVPGLSVLSMAVPQLLACALALALTAGVAARVARHLLVGSPMTRT